MEKRMITLLIILTILSLIHKHKAADFEQIESVTYLEYSESGMRYRTKYTYEQHEDGTCSLSREKDWREDNIRTVAVPASVGERLCQIVKEYKMYSYKSSYTPKMDVRDGIMWHLDARFDNGKKLYTGGENAWPDKQALERLEEYLYGLWERYNAVAGSGSKELPPAPEPKFPPDVCRMEYCVRGTVMYPLTHFLLTKAEGEERYWLVNASNRDRKDALGVEVPKSFCDRIHQIVTEEKMLEYKSYYQPQFKVLDGITWSLNIAFEYSKLSVSSAGHEEYPDGNGLSRLEKLCRETWEANEDKAQPYPLE